MKKKGKWLLSGLLCRKKNLEGDCSGIIAQIREKSPKLHNAMSRFIMTMLIFCGTMGVQNVTAQENKLPETSTSDSPKYYVLLNCETQKYMKYNGHSGTSYMKLDATVSDASLWYFEGTSVEEGCKIVTKAGAADGNSYKYLTNGEYSLNRIGKYSADGSTFYIHHNPSDEIGCVVSTTSGKPYSGMAKCMEEYGASEVAMNDLGGGEDFKWIFKSYDDLLEEAEANGVDISTYENLDQTSGTNFNNLITAINNAKSAMQAAQPTSGTVYLLKNRRYGYYLNSNGTTMYGACTATDYSTWLFQNIGGTPALVNQALNMSVRLNTEASNNKYYTLNPSDNQAYNATVIASSDGDRRFVAFQKTTIRTGATSLTDKDFYMAMVSDLTVEGREGQSFSSDWEFIEAEEGVNYDHVILSEDELLPTDENPTKAHFFRIRNVARSVKNYDEDIQFDGGGWLEDVDHTHAEYRKIETSTSAALFDQEEADLMYSAKDAEIYTAMPDMTHASALWEFVLVGHGSGNNENATGVISPEHNIYVIRNVNTGKYINGTAKTVNNPIFDVDVCESQDAAAMFYLEKLIDGQYAISVYAGTDGTGTDVKIGAIRVEATAEGYHGGLTFSGDAAVENSNSAWLIMPANTLELNIMTTSTNDGYEWSTMYYPFDVKPANVATGREIKFFHGAWIREPDYSNEPKKFGSVEMKEVVDVPGGNPVIVRTNTNSGESFGRLLLNVYPAGSGELETDASVFDGNAWRGITESEGHYFGDDWKNYWILSKNKNGDLKLLHPAGNYLLPNRAYIDNASAQESMGGDVKLSSITLVFPSEEVTGISNVIVNTYRDNAIYNIAGQKMENISIDQLPAGIYIQNGKKFLVK